MKKTANQGDDHALYKRCCLLQIAVVPDPFLHRLALVRHDRDRAALKVSGQQL
jgi:hypothetical protein